jgi:hypothetical protein
VTCIYCGGEAELVGGDAIYPHRPDLARKKFYRCQPCDAYVGCHAGTTKPYGGLANAETRAARQRAHAAFDPIWKDGKVRRIDAYSQLAKALGIPVGSCHMGMFDIHTCKRVVEAVENGLIL